MALKALALKEEGTHPPTEGVLARIADIRAIRSVRDVQDVARKPPDLVLVDITMRHVNAEEVVKVLRQAGPPCPMVMLLDWNEEPRRLLGQLGHLRSVDPAVGRRRPGMREMATLAGISQETLSRILKVSARTTHRWIKGARPRRKPELEKLTRLMSLLEATLPSKASISSYLHHPNPGFGGEKPLDLLLRGDFERVETDLLAIQEGVYV